MDNGNFEDMLRKVRRHKLAATLKSEPISLRCYVGAGDHFQVPMFRTAVLSVRTMLVPYNLDIRYEPLTLKNLRENRWSVADFVNWLLQSHIHFIIGHPHQGTEKFGWSVESLYAELQRLYHHPGFPAGDQLRCPIFTQNKWNYLEALPLGTTMPTFKIPISSETDMDAVETRVTGIWNSRSKDTRWIIKAPYVTNSNHFKFYPTTSKKAVSRIKSIIEDLFFSSMPTCYEIPYLMLQERVDQNKEAKLCFLNMKFSHLISSTTTRKSQRGFSTEELISFAYNALKMLETSCRGSCILDGLVRVDLFKSNDGKLVVNEFESLEARYFGDVAEMTQVENFLKDYWEIKISHCVNKLMRW